MTETTILNKSFFIGSLKIDNPLISAPMAGITCSPYRILMKNFGASLVFSEMVSCEALIRLNKKTDPLLFFKKNEHPIGIQLFGSNPNSMAEAAKIVESSSADLIDINMGCPVPKVLKTGAGSSLLLNFETAEKIVNKVIKSVKIPVTVKIRTDYRQDDNLGLILAERLIGLGISAISVHSRSCTQKFTGKADWKKIRDLKESSAVPVIGSGDIFSWEDVVNILTQTGVDGVMIARGAMGNPWIFSQAKAAIEKKEIPPGPTFEDKVRVAKELYKDLIGFYGEQKGVSIGRKHLLWLLKGIPKSNRVKDKILELRSSNEVLELLDDAEKMLH